MAGDTYLTDSVAKVVRNSALGFISTARAGDGHYYDPYGGARRRRPPGSIVQVAIPVTQYTPLGAIFKSAADID